MEPEEIVTNSIIVSSLITSEIQNEMAMPICEYSVRKNSIDGPLLTYANVGDVVYHVWECNGGNGIGILIKKCFVTDGDGDNHSVIDVNGCTNDKFLLSEVTYTNNLMKAYATSAVFKYADSNQLYFTCQIRLCQKQMGLCEGITPPTCSTVKEFPSKRTTIEENTENILKNTTSKKGKKKSELIESEDGDLILKSGKNKRATHNNDTENLMEIDVASPELLILDQSESVNFNRNNDKYCISKILFPVIPVSLIFIIFLSSVITLMVSNIVMRKNIRYGICA
uniref:ZP domain-containing protein n=1 Tax=Strongyloides venezuelensis TaxID=75913 RepID=A0A0K0F480_STRVS